MRELELLKIINTTLDKNGHIGDDCAYLKEFDMVITQDSFVEDVHFSRNFSSPYETGYKALIVNISDILAAGAKPTYATVSLSMPKSISNEYVKELYRAFNDVCSKFDMEIVGGDITGADKIFISICALGSTHGRQISSRANAKCDDVIIITGISGSSAAGLFVLQNNISGFENIVKEHKTPEISLSFSEQISKKAKRYAMMDTSDGLADALIKIAAASNKELSIDLNSVPFDQNIKNLAEKYQKNYKDWILYGGEDYKLVACTDLDTLKSIPENTYKIIGKVNEFSQNYVKIIDGSDQYYLNDTDKMFNHFS